MKTNIPIVLSLFLLSACGMRKDDPTAHAQSSSPSTSLASLAIEPKDWNVESITKNNTHITTRTLKAEKLDFVMRNFRQPSLSPITVPESNGFEVYEIKGYAELEQAAYIHPKIYINTGTAQGSILGYKVGVKGPAGEDLIEISLPVALVNGLVPSIPTAGGPSSGVGAAVSLPEKYRIANEAALETRVGKKVSTLPVCPKLFRLTFEDKEYWAKSPFDRECPLNEFFRIKFRAAASEMKRMLEVSAVADEAVNLITELSFSMGVQKKTVQFEIPADEFKKVIEQKLKDTSRVSENSKDTSLVQNEGYSIQQLEEVVTESLLSAASALGIEVRYGVGLSEQVRPLIANYFSEPFSCHGGMCRKLLNHSFQYNPVSFSWSEKEFLFSPLETQTVSSLGAVANSSLFEAKPDQSQFIFARRPKRLQGMQWKDVVEACEQQINFASPTDTADTIETPEQRQYLQAYCTALVESTKINENDPEQADGYYPLGSNTVVYPGAWIKIDLDEIAEFTTAKTRKNAQGREILESQVIDLLNPEMKASAPLTTCLEGSETACEVYETERKEYRDHEGNPVQGPCIKGTPDCVCSKKSENDPETCSRGWYEVLSYECDPSSLHTFCPYFRTQKDVISYTIENSCQQETVEDKTTFLCLGGCTKKTQTVCKETKKEPVREDRTHLNCVDDDPSGIAPRESYCAAPKYKCKKWRETCKRYSVNSAFLIQHEEVAPKWRPFAITQGEFPKRFEQDVYLKFVSPAKTVKNCRLDRFARKFIGNSILIKLPSEENEGIIPCDEPLWEKGGNTEALYLPTVYIKNKISYFEERRCGKTEYSFLAKSIPSERGSHIVPASYTREMESHIGPVLGSCQAQGYWQKENDYWFREYPLVRFSGRVSVLGRVLESLVTQTRP